MFVAKPYSAMRLTGYENVILTILCFLINGIVSEIPSKSVNLAIETSFLIEPQDLKQNFSGLSNLQSFIDKIQNQLNPNGDRPVFRSRKSQQAAISNFDLSEFVQELGVLLLNYEEEDVRKLVIALKDTLGERSNDPKFNVIFSNDKLKTMLTNKATELAIADPLRIKVDISKYITRKENEITPFSKFIGRLGRLLNYHPNLKTLLKQFKAARETKVFTKPVENAFRYFFYQWDKMDNLSKTKVRELLSKLSGEDANDITIPKRRNHRRYLDNDIPDFSESLQDNGTFPDNSINIETVIELNKNLEFSVSSNFISNSTRDMDDEKKRGKNERRADRVSYLYT